MPKQETPDAVDTINFDEETRVQLSDGRTFKITEATTSRQDMWVMTRLDRAGLEAISQTYNTPEKLDEMAVKLVEEAYEKGLLYEILAGILVEEGVKWTQESAKANAEYFADLSNPGDKAAIQGPVASILLLYFASGLASRMTSLKSLAEEMGSEAAPQDSAPMTSSATPKPVSSSRNGSRKRGGPALHVSKPAGSKTSATGKRSRGK